MRISNKIILSVSFLFALLSPVLSQETNYWTQQQGSKSTLMGGAAVASIRDNSSIYYNPGAMAFIDNPSLSISANTYFINQLEISNGAGEDLNLKSSALDIVPQILSGIIKDFEKPDITISYAILNTAFSSYDIALRHEMKYDVLEDWPGDENYISGYRYSNRIRDDWLGLGSSKRLSEKVGIGLSMFATFRSQTYYNAIETSAIVYDSSLMAYNTIGQSSFAEELNFMAAGLIWKLGLGVHLDNLNMGLSITTPRVDLNFLGQAKLYRSAMVSLEQIMPTNPKIITSQENLQTSYKSPWIFDLGLEYSIKNTAIAVRMAYFTSIDAYHMVDTTDVKSYSTVYFPEADFGVPKTAHRSVINLALGIVQKINEKIDILGGFRTDFNYLDNNVLDENVDFIPYLNYWDLYHFTWGVTIHLGASDLTFGLGYTRGKSDHSQQEVNLSNPILDRYLFGEKEFTASARYFQLNAVLGFLYFF